MVIVAKVVKVAIKQPSIPLMIQWSKLPSSTFAKHGFSKHRGVVVHCLRRDYDDIIATWTLTDTSMVAYITCLYRRVCSPTMKSLERKMTTIDQQRVQC
jgi:hypothetical protein